MQKLSDQIWEKEESVASQYKVSHCLNQSKFHATYRAVHCHQYGEVVIKMVDIEAISLRDAQLRKNSLKSKVQGPRVIADLTEEKLIETIRALDQRLQPICSLFLLPLTQFEVLQDSILGGTDEPDTGIEDRSENLEGSEAAENMHRQLWKVYPYVKLGTLADLIKDFGSMKSKIAQSKSSVLTITNILLEIAIALCDTMTLVLETFSQKCSHDELRATIKELIRPDRIFISFKDGQQMTKLKPISRTCLLQSHDVFELFQEMPFEQSIELLPVTQITQLLSQTSIKLCSFDLSSMIPASAADTQALKKTLQHLQATQFPPQPKQEAELTNLISLLPLHARLRGQTSLLHEKVSLMRICTKLKFMPADVFKGDQDNLLSFTDQSESLGSAVKGSGSFATTSSFRLSSDLDLRSSIASNKDPLTKHLLTDD